ncbi:MAG: methyltransferase domain-containing protein [Chitinophagaceae bacterium]
MELGDAIKLIKDESLQHTDDAVWADLGSGSGLFTYALANLLPPGGFVYSIDKTDIVLKKQVNPNNITVRQLRLNFDTDELNLHNLDGILMANSLHFVKNKQALILKLAKNLKPEGSFLIVEYNTDSSNPWVPFPLSYYSLKEEFKKAGYNHIQKLHERQSAFGRSQIYSAYINR